MESLLAWDRALFLSINQWELGSVGVVLFQGVTLLCNWPGSLCLLALLVWIWRFRGRKLALMLLMTLLISGVTNSALKSAVQRPRPLAVMVEERSFIEAPGWGEEVEVGVMVLRTRSLYARSFPSGHAQHAFAWMMFFALVWRRWALLFLVSAAAVGLSRVYLGVHYPLDVLVGMFLGVMFAVMGYRLWRGWEGRGREGCLVEEASLEEAR